VLERLLGECFGTKPAVVYLEPFDDEEQKQFFDAAFPGEDFASFVKETEPFELHPLLKPMCKAAAGRSRASGRIYQLGHGISPATASSRPVE